MPNTDVSSLGSGVLLRTTQTSFDVRLESDVIALLRTIHVNTIDPDLKNHLRDLIFSYRQSMSAVDLVPLVQTFKELGITIVVDTTATIKDVAIKVVPEKKPSYISSARPQPRFVTVVSKPLVKTTIEPIGVPSYNEDVVVPITPPATVIPPIADPVIKQSISEPITEVPIAKIAEVVQEVTPTPIPVPQVAAVTYANPADRIKEIKHQVNEKVGNPINLIDAHNEVGREYMNALLDAMKKSNGGQVQEVSEAMARLEKAFIAVLTAIGQGSLVHGTSAATPVETKVPLKPTVDTVSQIEPVDSKAPLNDELQSVDTSVNPIKINIVQEIVADDAIGVGVAIASTSGFAKVSQNLSNTSEEKTVIEEIVPTPIAQSINPSFHSVAEDKSLQDSVRLQREDISKQLQKEEAVKVSQMDPLQTPEITAGLGQLLSEWSLFKSSGIFGTGPSGKDHVLYMKLAPLTMSAVIAGRFEGVTPKIKQSISDYMNGWRYEEGVAHEHGETFEHYLRRVIHHILNKQKQAG